MFVSRNCVVVLQGNVSFDKSGDRVGNTVRISQYIPGTQLYMNQGVQGKCIATPTRTTSFSKEKGAALGGTRTHDTLLSRQSALPTELHVYTFRSSWYKCSMGMCAVVYRTC